MRNKFFIAIASLLLIFTVSLSYAQTLQEYFAKAKEAYAAKDYDEALSNFQNVLALLKKNKRMALAQKIQINIANIYMQQDKCGLSLKELESAAKLFDNPKDKTKFNMFKKMAQAHYCMKEYLRAIEGWEAILSSSLQLTSEQKAGLYASIADAYRRDELYFSSIQNYKKALSLYEEIKNVEKQNLILTATGLCFNKIGDFSNAITTLKTSLEITEKKGTPHSIAEANSNLGIVYFDMGEYAKANKYFAEALKIEKTFYLKRNHGVDLNNKGILLKSVGKYSEALSTLEESIRVAQQVKNTKDEAIAWSNRALVLRIMGQTTKALGDYQKALKLYEKDKFKEGIASCYLGIGKLYEIRDLNYQKAYEYYQKAFEIYDRLGNVGYQAEALNQIGRVFKKTINKSKSSQSFGALVFEEEPVYIEVSSAEAAKESTKAYEKALDLGRTTMRNEIVWSALQGIGYALAEQGQLEQALPKYKAAIETVIGIRGGSDSDLMADYLRDKEDLFTEAIELCANLYEAKKDDEYLRLQMEYQEIYKNEIMKNAMNVAKIEYENPEKATIANQMNALLAKQKKVNQLVGQQQAKAKQDDSPKEVNEELKAIQKESQELEGTFKELLAKWKKQYPQDANLFDSSQKIDLKAIQASLGDDEAVIQYMPLTEFLGILCITKKNITYAKTDITYKKLSELIRDEFSFDNIDVYGHENYTKKKYSKNYSSEAGALTYCIKTLNKLYTILIKPIQSNISDKFKLKIVTSKYLSYLPFEALAANDNPDNPMFLIQKYVVSYTRIAFIGGNKQVANLKKPSISVIGVGNPEHEYLKSLLVNLPAAEKEIETMKKIALKNNIKNVTVMFGKNATEDAWRDAITDNSYSIFYFATHGVPAAEIYIDTIDMENRFKKWNKSPDKYKKSIDKYTPFVDFSKKTFTVQSPLYGFIYMTNSDTNDGVLTLKEVLEIDDNCFSNAQLAVLSACNTAVTYSPKISKKHRQEFSKNAEKDLIASGFTPGVDQVSLTDTFLKRNFKNVVGTLWFADDPATSFIMSKFFKELMIGLSPAEALRNAKLAYLTEGKDALPENYTSIPSHPFYWAVTSVFGR